MKTIEEHFIESMPADIAAMAIANTKGSLLELQSYKTPEAALQHAFTWCDTKQGNLFWSQVFDTLQADADFRDMESAIKNELINEIIDIWINNKGIALGRLWMLDEMICELEKDKARLDWLLRDTTFLTGISSREKIDAAMDEEWCERERRDKILSGMDAEDFE